MACAACVACGSRQTSTAPAEETPEACAARARGFREFVAALPERAVASTTRVKLPESTLGAAPGSGPVVELSPTELVIDGDVVQAAALEERLRRFREWVTGWSAAAPAEPPKPGPPAEPSGPGAPAAARRALYVAASPDLDVRTLRAFLSDVPGSVELRLLVRTASPIDSVSAGKGSDAARRIAARVRTEPDADRRRRIAADAYAAFSRCAELTSAVASVNVVDARQRWPALRSALLASLPGCRCGDLDTASLELLIGAEQRAGAASLGWVPLSFLRDERCDATMPLRSVQKLVHQIDQFDAEFSAAWRSDTLTFDDVLVNDRLRVYFCDALPGETLAAMQRARATLYLRQGSQGCDPWTFEPLAPGAPMGTWRRAPASSRQPLAFHYWQAAEEIRVFGPVDASAPSRPTDARDWPCEETFRLIGTDEDSILSDKGRWFYSEAACARAPGDTVAWTGCIAASATGSPQPAEGARTEPPRPGGR